jgi:L-ornithine N5-oxygenase
MSEPTVGPPPLPVLASPWRIRPVRGDADVRLVCRWMNEPHVARAWNQAWPEERWAAELAEQSAGEHSLPCIVHHDDEPVAYVEIYRVVRDHLAPHYPARPHDLGVHVAIGDPDRIGRGLGSVLLEVVADGLLAVDPHCDQVVAEPNVSNVASLRAFHNAGFRRDRLVTFPHKTAALLIRRRTHTSEEPVVHDVIGIGFGPANLALAAALHEHERGALVGARFFERQPRFGWHRDLLIDGATVQVSFLKDLVTMRNPTSEFGFLSYLRAKDRLVDFVNHKCLYPSRVEFNDYLEWVARRFAPLVRYGTDVLGVRPVVREGGIATMEVSTSDGVHTARDIVIAPGLCPVLPDGMTASARIWHSDTLLSRLDSMTDEPKRVVVVGAGQSGAEVVEYLHRRFSGAEVHAVFSRYGYTPADDTPFVNGVFDPAAVDLFHGAPDEVKRMVLDYHRNTNYSVVDHDLIDDLYRRGYQELVTGQRRLRMRNLSRVESATETDSGVRVVVQSLARGDREVIDADLVVFATGYRETDVFALLGEMGAYCLRDEHGRPQVDRDYRVRTVEGVTSRIYLQGPTEHTHGIGSGLLSNVAVRAGEIAQSLVDRTTLPAVNGSRLAGAGERG